MHPEDMVHFHMNSDAWKTPLNLEFMQANKLTGPQVLECFMGTNQTNGNTGLEGTGVVLNIIHTMMYQGPGWTEKGSCRTQIFLELSNWLAEK